MIDRHTAEYLLVHHKNDLVTLANAKPKMHATSLYIHAIIEALTLLSNNFTSEPGKQLTQYLQNKKILLNNNILSVLLTENGHYSTRFTKLIDQYNDKNDGIKERLYQFLQDTLGPEIQLSEKGHNNELVVAMQFPTHDMRDIFIKELDLPPHSLADPKHENCFNSVKIQDNSTLLIPAVKAENQQLVIKFSSISLKNNFMHFFNIPEQKFVFTNNDDSTLSINDRRIHDTASGFHVSITCQFLLDYLRIRMLARTIAQGQRDPHGFFSKETFPEELDLKLICYSIPSKTIDDDSTIRIAKEYFSKN